MESPGLKIRAWRLARGVSQRELAAQSGLSRPNLIGLELGRRDCTVKTLCRLAHVLAVSPGTLLDERPVEAVPRLTRHDKEKIAQYIVTGKGQLKPSHQELALRILPLLRSALQANGIKRSVIRTRQTRQHRYEAELHYPRKLILDICKRVRKVIPLYAERQADG